MVDVQAGDEAEKVKERLVVVLLPREITKDSRPSIDDAPVPASGRLRWLSRKAPSGHLHSVDLILLHIAPRPRQQ